MINDKLKTLITLLTEKTKNKEAIWNKSSGNDQFELLLPNNIAVTVSSFEGNYNEVSSFSVNIYNSNGDAIQRYSTDDSSSPEELNLISSFHQAASDAYYKVDETFDTLINSVKSVGTIGTVESERKDDISDDLPF